MGIVTYKWSSNSKDIKRCIKISNEDAFKIFFFFWKKSEKHKLIV